MDIEEYISMTSEIQELNSIKQYGVKTEQTINSILIKEVLKCQDNSARAEQ